MCSDVYVPICDDVCNMMNGVWPCVMQRNLSIHRIGHGLQCGWC